MASTYTIKKGDTLDTVAKQLGVNSSQLASNNNLQSGAQLTEGNVLNVPIAQQNTNAAPAASAHAPAAPAATPYTGLAGLSDNTKQQLGNLSTGYTPSESVNAAQQYLNSVIAGKPGDYQSQYKGQLESLYNQVMNRDPFQFDLNGEVLYNQYKDQYTQQGQRAMRDTMGQAAAMTGGYGNSYAQTAGQQAFQDYLTQLNNIVPELYQQAYNRYSQEGADLQNKLSMTQSLEDNAYGQYRDTVTDWNNLRNQASNDYWNQRDADYNQYADTLNYWNAVAQRENAQYNADRDMAYAQAMAVLSTGNMPSADLLTMAGISSTDAKQIANANKKVSYSGGSKSSSGGSKSSAPAPAPAPESNAGGTGGLSGLASSIVNAAKNLANNIGTQPAASSSDELIAALKNKANRMGWTKG